MSTREKAQALLDSLTDEQVEEFWGLLMDVKFCVPNDELLEAFAEADDIMKHPENYKSYTDVDKMFEEILSEDDDAV